MSDKEQGIGDGVWAVVPSDPITDLREATDEIIEFTGWHPLPKEQVDALVEDTIERFKAIMAKMEVEVDSAKTGVNSAWNLPDTLYGIPIVVTEPRDEK